MLFFRELYVLRVCGACFSCFVFTWSYFMCVFFWRRGVLCCTNSSALCVCMCVYVYVYIYTFVQIYQCVQAYVGCLCAYVCICLCICMYHTCTNVHIYIYKDTPLCVGICVGHVYVCVYMCVYAYVYPCMHAHASACTHTLSNIAGVLREREGFFFLHSAYREQDKQKMKTRMLYVGS